ncbi:MAG: GNAT family N-acetyltransferase [Nostoc sp. DedQUE04]|uniref:GNAT family N-acetyltransferase n=1 Tax=Nostoc sp. DedQUE04 TaxID=3075390 RepID=UPI002AD4D702|nr:GNAT family N-acetyltransferase [Nostoc sp. DedQUE04]MDZ8140923.1 GNAT family N-acetyltransferase [Nostoc sp. DedQUE04]
MSEQLLPGYIIRRGSLLERSLLLKFMQRTYQDLFPNEDFSHLEQTVKQYFSSDTPLWWVEEEGEQGAGSREQGEQGEMRETRRISNAPCPIPNAQFPTPNSPIACLWVGNAIDQVHGNRHAHIFILYVVPEHRRRGIGTALMEYVENWAIQRGDRQIGLQVFQSNKPALNLYNQLGYQTQSLWMVKFLSAEK